MQLRATSNETSSSATIPPKRTPTLCTRNNACAAVDSAIRAPQLLFASCQTQHVRRMSQFALDCLAERESAEIESVNPVSVRQFSTLLVFIGKTSQIVVVNAVRHC